MYKYVYESANLGYFKQGTDHIEAIIDEYASKGYRFVTSIPAAWGMDGRISRLTLVFEYQI